MDYRELVKELKERKRISLYNGIIKYAETLTHKRLKKVLGEYARIAGCTSECSCFEESIDPDIVTIAEGNACIFIGDAKVAQNEGPSRTDTAVRIFRYMLEFYLFCENDYEEGIFAIATNKEKDALDWVTHLSTTSALLSNIYVRKPMQFEMQKLDEATYVISGKLTALKRYF